MNRIEALEIARTNRKHHKIANWEFTKNVWAVMTDIDAREQAQRDLDRTYGYSQGWYAVEDFSFGEDELTGTTYDHTQGGWAWL